MSLSFYLPIYLLSKRKCLENSHGFLSFSKLIFVGIYFLYNIVLVSAVQQNVSAIHLHTQPTPFWISFPFRSPCALSRVPWVIQQVLLSYLFYMQYNSVGMSIPVFQFIAPFSLGIHTFVLYVSVSISALQISLSREKVS